MTTFHKSNAMSDFNHIQQLLEKYWEGETSVEEERQLKSYFNFGEIDPQHQKYAPMFQAFKAEQSVQYHKRHVLPLRPQMYWAAAASVALLLTAGVWWFSAAPNTTHQLADTPSFKQQDTLPTIAITPANQHKEQPQKSYSAQIVKPKKVRRPETETLAVDPEEAAAMAEIKAALALVSSKMRKGRYEAAKGAIHLETIDKIFKKKEG
jgi:hypothetical protein